jgi:nucleotide-binding universal stress UspA family protein
MLDRIVMVVDETTSSSSAMAAALLFAHGECEVIALSVLDVQRCHVGEEEDLAPVQRRVGEAVERFRAAGIACSGQVRRVVDRSVSVGLLEAVAELRPSLVVIGAGAAAGWGLPFRNRRGRTMLRKAGCAVLVVPESHRRSSPRAGE